MKLLYRKLKKIARIIQFHAKRALSSKKVVLIYQMGKVGSRSIVDSLGKYRSIYVLHVHYANPLKNQQVAYRVSQKALNEPKHIYIGKMVYKYIFQRGKPVKIITIVRDPISRNKSAFFQNINFFVGNPKYTPTIKELINIFIKLYDHDVPLNWFDDEFNVTCKFDIYQTDFPREQGWVRILKNNLDVLVLKLEMPDKTKEEQIAKFLNLPKFKLVRSNIGDQKEYAQKYAKFKDEIKLPKTYVEKMCSSKYMRHFYTDSEIERIRDRWL